MKLSLIFLTLLLLTSCSITYFDSTQPMDVANSTKIPSEFQGYWSNNDEQLTINSTSFTFKDKISADRGKDSLAVIHRVISDSFVVKVKFPYCFFNIKTDSNWQVFTLIKTDSAIQVAIPSITVDNIKNTNLKIENELVGDDFNSYTYTKGKLTFEQFKQVLNNENERILLYYDGTLYTGDEVDETEGIEVIEKAEEN